MDVSGDDLVFVTVIFVLFPVTMTKVKKSTAREILSTKLYWSAVHNNEYACSLSWQIVHFST